MSTWTYSDATVGTIVDGEIITLVERFAGGEHEFIRITTATGGRRTEKATEPLAILHWADPRLVDVTALDMATGVDYFVEWLGLGEADNYPALLTGLHGLALEINRRRALACIRRECVCHGRGR